MGLNNQTDADNFHLVVLLDGIQPVPNPQGKYVDAASFNELLKLATEISMGMAQYDNERNRLYQVLETSKIMVRTLITDRRELLKMLETVLGIPDNSGDQIGNIFATIRHLQDTNNHTTLTPSEN